MLLISILRFIFIGAPHMFLQVLKNLFSLPINLLLNLLLYSPFFPSRIYREHQKITLLFEFKCQYKNRT